MGNNSKWTPLLAVVVIIVLAFFGGRFFYYNTGASAYTPPERELTNVQIENYQMAPRAEVVDNPTSSRGTVVIDYTHRNALFIEELNVLLSKIVARGFSYEIALTSDDSEENGDEPSLKERLRYAQALILPLPRVEYTVEEIGEIKRFVEKGGQLLIIGDPTRTVQVEGINSIAGEFGIIYANDYLYSLASDYSDNNYRNVIYTKFNNSPITQGLGATDKVVFYSGNSISAPNHEIIMGNESVKSSISEVNRTMAAAVLTTNDQVLALGDLTFFTEPYSAVESNGTLINNIADFLTDTSRSFDLKDFPYFFNPNVNVVFDNSLVFNSQFDDSVKLKGFLEERQRTVDFVDNISGDDDIIFVSRFDKTKMVDEYLDAADIAIIEEIEEPKNGQEEVTVEADEEDVAEDATAEEETISQVSDDPAADDKDQEFVEGRIQIGGVGELELGGSTLFYLHQEAGRNMLIMLSDNPSTNADAFELLLDGEFTDCLVSANIAVCQTEEPDKRQLPSVRSTRVDKILVVSDDDGREREDAQTSATEYRNVLSDTYKVDIWITSDGDPLDLDELQEYDAIIWTTGDYWDDSLDEEAAELLTEYIAAGGNLLLSGASIAFDWDHTDFLENIVHADYITVAEQQDIEASFAGHPIAKGFEEGDVITFLETPSGEPLEIDVVNHTPNARVIFQRGPESAQSGAASVIAYEDDRSKVAYFAFPFYLLPVEAQATLANNSIDWFTRKPLDLPDEKNFTPFEQDESDAEEPADDQQEESEEETEENGEDNGNEGG